MYIIHTYVDYICIIIHTHMHMYVVYVHHTYVHTYLRTYIHIYIHTYVCNTMYVKLIVNVNRLYVGLHVYGSG